MYNLVITNGQAGFLICTKYVEMYILISTQLYKYIRLGIQVSLNITPVVSCTFLPFLIMACVVCTAFLCEGFLLLAIYTCFSMYIDFVLVSV